MKGQADAEGKPRDIRVRTFEFAVRVVQLCQYLDGQPGVGRTLWKQLFRAGTGVGANVEEAQAGQSKPDFISKYAIALNERRARLTTGCGSWSPVRSCPKLESASC